MISTMMDIFISMHLYYESGAVAAVTVDRSATSSWWTEREEEATDDDDEWRAYFLSQAWTSSGN